MNVNVVKAGLVDTDSTKVIPNSEQMFERRREKTMMGDRMLLADDVANAVLFLASDEAGYITGAEIVVDGGYTAQ